MKHEIKYTAQPANVEPAFPYLATGRSSEALYLVVGVGDRMENRQAVVLTVPDPAKPHLSKYYPLPGKISTVPKESLKLFEGELRLSNGGPS